MTPVDATATPPLTAGAQRINAILLTLMVLAVAAAPVVGCGWLVVSALRNDEGRRGKVVFEQVEIGDTEEHLRELLNASQVTFHCYVGRRHKDYSHSHDFLGLAIYQVIDGRVASKAVD
jgi:hypothetical protein